MLAMKVCLAADLGTERDPTLQELPINARLYDITARWPEIQLQLLSTTVVKPH